MNKMKLDIQRFATTLSVGGNYTQSWQSGNSVGGTKGAFKWRIVVDYTSRNIEANTSVIRIRFQEYGTWGSYSGMNATYSRMKISINGGGYSQLAYAKTPSYTKGNTETKLDVNYTVSHNQDGSCPSIVIQCANETTNTKSYAPANKTITSDTIYLTQIPRASAITSVTDGTTDYAPTVTWTPMSSTFTYKINYSYNGWSYTTGLISPATTNAYSYSGYTITGADLASYMPSTSGSFVATLYTYQANGTTQIGNATTKNFTVTLNGSYKPTASISTFSDVGGIVPSSWGIFVAGKSKLSFTVGGTASTGSSISSYTTTANGSTYTTTRITTDWINNSGTVYTYVRDSRGRQSDTISRAYTVYPYSAPSITTATAERCLADGTLSNTGTYLKYSFKATYSTCNNHNDVICKLRYKTKTDSTYSEVAISNGASGIVLPNVTFSAGSSYDIQFAVTDTFTTTPVTSNRSIGTGFRLVHYNKNHKAIAIGKQSEATGDNKLLEVALPLSFSSDAKKSVIDLIYPIGSVYISMGQNPNTLFGGTWVQLSGQYLLAWSEGYGSTGGSLGTGSTTLGVEHIPWHTHSIPQLSGTAASNGNHSHAAYGGANTQSSGGKEGLESYGSRYKTFRKIEQGTYDAGSHTHSVTTNANTTGGTGSTQGHSHTTDWQPWLKVAVWKRTA